MYQFTEDCCIGIEHIDAEHKQLFAMINEGMDLLKGDEKMAYAGAKSLIPSLRRYAALHFAHEEEYMESIHDRELALQKEEHRQFAQYVNNFDLDDLQENHAREALDNLLQYLARWLYHHILGSDMMIGYNLDEGEEDTFAFSDKYKTGIQLVDDEHRRLFEIIKETNDAVQAELVHDKFDLILDIINELKDYTILHFKDEETYMEKINYEGLPAQRLAHEAFVEKLKLINLDEVDDNQQEYLEDLIEFLLGWLSTHILKMDKKIPVK